jgi:hypothetical protein
MANSMNRVKVSGAAAVTTPAATYASCGADEIAFFTGANRAADAAANAATFKDFASRIGERPAELRARPAEGKVLVYKFQPGGNALDKGYTVSEEWTDAAPDDDCLAIVVGRDIHQELDSIAKSDWAARAARTHKIALRDAAYFAIGS